MLTFAEYCTISEDSCHRNKFDYFVPVTGKIFEKYSCNGNFPKHADYVLRDNTDYPAENSIPLWLIGMMW